MGRRLRKQKRFKIFSKLDTRTLRSIQNTVVRTFRSTINNQQRRKTTPATTVQYNNSLLTMMAILSLVARSSVRFSRTAASAVASSSVLPSSSSLAAAATTTTTTTVRNLNSIFSGVFSDQNSSTATTPNTTSSTTVATTNATPTHTYASHGGHVMKESFSTKAAKAESESTTVSRRRIAEEVAEAHELSVAKSERIISMVFDTITEAVSDSKSVQISKFGTFEKFTSPARTGRNPQTGEPLDIPSKERIRFRPAKHFKDTVQ